MCHGNAIGELVDEQVGHSGQRRGARSELVHHQSERHDVSRLLRLRYLGGLLVIAHAQGWRFFADLGVRLFDDAS